MVLLLGRLAALKGIRLCPNYLITLNTLTFSDQTLYTAHEIAQMIPLAGLDVYNQLKNQNDWIEVYLPNLSTLPAQDERASLLPPNRRNTWLEAVMRAAPFNFLEQWEMKRKIHQLMEEQGSSPESVFASDICKGHAHLHQGHTQLALNKRLNRLQQEIKV
jgi:hypothetical protein